MNAGKETRQLEICCGDLDSVRAAVAGGADRIELCSALAVGGLTPSVAMIKTALDMRGTTAVHVLIRPREGDFVLSPDEVDVACADIRAARVAGVQGVVIGAQTPDGNVDMNACRRMMDAAGDLSVTFHRAFDRMAHPEEALEDVIALGCHRLLTSGCAPTALEGAETLRRLNKQADGRIIILGASGVSPENAGEILARSGIGELHASARSPRLSSMTFRRGNVAMGTPGADEFTRMVTDIDKVRRLVDILHNC